MYLYSCCLFVCVIRTMCSGGGCRNAMMWCSLFRINVRWVLPRKTTIKIKTEKTVGNTSMTTSVKRRENVSPNHKKLDVFWHKA